MFSEWKARGEGVVEVVLVSVLVLVLGLLQLVALVVVALLQVVKAAVVVVMGVQVLDITFQM